MPSKTPNSLKANLVYNNGGGGGGIKSHKNEISKSIMAEVIEQSNKVFGQIKESIIKQIIIVMKEMTRESREDTNKI